MSRCRSHKNYIREMLMDRWEVKIAYYKYKGHQNQKSSLLIIFS